MKKLYLLLCVVLLASCNLSAYGAGDTVLPVTTPARSATPTAAPTSAATPDYKATALMVGAKVTDAALAIGRERLELDRSIAATQAAMQETAQYHSYVLMSTRISADAYAERIEAEARVEATGTLTALAVTQTSLPIQASVTQQAADAVYQAALLADLQAQSTSQASDATSAANSARARAAATDAHGTMAAPYTATVEAQRLEDKLDKMQTGSAMLAVVGWGALILLGLGLISYGAVIIGAKWNREVIDSQIDLGKNSLFQGANGEALAWNGAEYVPIGAAAPTAAQTANPVRSIPIYGVGAKPGPKAQLSEIGQRILWIVQKSIQLYGADSNKVAGYRDTTGSGDTWSVAMNILQAAGVALKRTQSGTTLESGVTLADLAYDIEMGEVKL